MNTIYTKYTDYRRSRFRLMTSIREEKGMRSVVKANAPGGDAAAHLERIARNRNIMQRLYGKQLEVCPCRWDGKELEFPYIEGTSFLDRLRRAGNEDGLKGFLKLLHEYVRILEGPEKNQMVFRYTDEFALVFGRVAHLQDTAALQVSNLDASPGNLIDDGAHLNLIDYEWVFTFPIPRDFIVFRHLRFLYAEQGLDFLSGVTLGDLLAEFDVKLDLSVLTALYDGFQQYVCVEDNADLSCAEVFERHRRPIYDAGEGFFRRPQHFVFLDTGNGFNEQEKLVFPGEDGNLRLRFGVDGVYNIRFDPFEGHRTLLDHLSFTTDAGEKLEFQAPERRDTGSRTILNRPANAAVAIPEGTRELTIDGFALFMNERDDYWVAQTDAAETRIEELGCEIEEDKLRRQAEQQAAEAQRRTLETRIAERDQTIQTKEQALAASQEAREAEKAAQQARSQQEAAQLTAANERISQLEGELTAIRNSRSWRATSWLRRLAAPFRRA